jgi:hypothetical protein
LGQRSGALMKSLCVCCPPLALRYHKPVTIYFLCCLLCTVTLPTHL